jgi:peptidyl-prolyl cis-trans isomerase A (cyclophilin A)
MTGLNRSRAWLTMLAVLVAAPACSQNAGDAQEGATTHTEQRMAQAAAEKPKPAVTEETGEPLMNPNSKEMTLAAPAKFKAKFETSKGNFVLEVTREWAPIGADRFFNLVRHGYYDNCRFFRMVPGFVVQWGIHGDPAISKHWNDANMKDDPVKASNKRGFITYAKTNAPDSRSTQLFINFADNSRLDGMGFAPFGQVTEGMDIVEKLYSGYKEQPTNTQGEIMARGNAFLNEKFPQLDYIKKASIVE